MVSRDTVFPGNFGKPRWVRINYSNNVDERLGKVLLDVEITQIANADDRCAEYRHITLGPNAEVTQSDWKPQSPRRPKRAATAP